MLRRNFVKALLASPLLAAIPLPKPKPYIVPSIEVFEAFRLHDVGLLSDQSLYSSLGVPADVLQGERMTFQAEAVHLRLFEERVERFRDALAADHVLPLQLLRG